MNDREMRDRVDQVLTELETRLQKKRRTRMALAGPVAGLALALDACVKVKYGVPVYGIEVDAADAGAADLVALYGALDAGTRDAIASDLSTLYGIQDAGELDQTGFEAGVRYGIQCDAGSDDV